MELRSIRSWMDWFRFLGGSSSLSALRRMPRSTPAATIGPLGTQLRSGSSLFSKMFGPMSQAKSAPGCLFIARRYFWGPVNLRNLRCSSTRMSCLPLPDDVAIPDMSSAIKR
uniref:Uncharacterized protein n=1 Tax=Arundo donax TaxID=35708 RepID=A0A0A9EDI2_ARUDO